jgi:hypothetical protein
MVNFGKILAHTRCAPNAEGSGLFIEQRKLAFLSADLLHGRTLQRNTHTLSFPLDASQTIRILELPVFAGVNVLGGPSQVLVVSMTIVRPGRISLRIPW